jgi:secreted PhoX family phosphatase
LPSGRFGFQAIPIATDDTIHVPEGFSWQVVARWGDPLFSDAPAFDPETGVTTEGAARAVGDNTDGMEMFTFGTTQVLAVNNEYTNLDVLLPEAAAEALAAAEAAAAAATTEEDKEAAMDYAVLPRTPDEVLKVQASQGVTVMELAEGPQGWTVVVDSPYNRASTTTRR